MNGLGVTTDQVIALADRMAQSPADSVALASQLVDMLQQLPPPASQLISRPKFERASLWTFGCSFENVRVGSAQVPAQVIRVPHDCWIRDVTLQAIPDVRAIASANTLAAATTAVDLLRKVRFSLGNNGRGLAQVNWRLDGRQGFISRGQSEALLPASMVTGDGCFPCAKDWQLQSQQTIEVRLENIMNAIGFTVADANLLLRWVTVTFWGEELDQPSIQ